MQRSVTQLIRVACVLALVALSVMAYSIVSPRPLPVILAMSVGHVLGAAAFCAYLLAVIVDAARARTARSSIPPGKCESSSVHE